MSNRPKAIPLERRIAVAAIVATIKGGGHLDMVLEEGFKRHADKTLPDNIRGAAWSLAYGYFRVKGHIDAILTALLDRPLKASALEAEIWIGLGLYEILFSNTPDHAAVHTAVEAIGRHKRANVRHLKNLANAILRRALREAETIRADVAAHPDRSLPNNAVKRMTMRFGLDITKQIATAIQAPPPLDLTLKDPETTAAYQTSLFGESFMPGHIRLRGHQTIQSLPGYKNGDWWIQDFAASLPVRALNIPLGTKVLDLCAAPGGKTLQLAAQGAEVTALEISAERVGRIRENLKRTDLDAHIVVEDALQFEPEGLFDVILLDAPCSATGTIRRHPELPWVRDDINLKDLADIQVRMLARALDWLKPGGHLMYAVCSLEEAEGPAVIEKVLAAKSGVKITPIMADTLGPAKAGLRPDGTVQTRPDMALGQGGMDGFFMALLTH